METISLRLGEPQPIEDAFLEDGEFLSADEDPTPPFDLEIIRPRVIDILRLHRLAGKPLPADYRATVGAARLPILLCHGFTPFHPAGGRHRAIWGLGYEVRPVGLTEAHTVDVKPDSSLLELGRVEQSVTLGVSFGGGMSVPEAAIPIVDAVPGIALKGAEIHASTDQSFSLALKLDLNLLAIQAAPTGSGGARWQLYRQQRRLDLFQPLFQTLLIPEDCMGLALEIRTWIRRRGWLGNLLRSWHWQSDWEPWTVSLEHLSRLTEA